METKIETNVTLVELIHLINQNELLSRETKLAILQLIKQDENKIESHSPKEITKKKESSLRRLSNSPTFFNLPGIKNANFLRNSSSSSSLGSPSSSTSASSSPKVQLNDFHKFPLSDEIRSQYFNTALVEFEKKKAAIGFSSPDEQYEILAHVVSNHIKVFVVAIGDILGEGVAGKVCKVWDMETKELLAAKVYNTIITNHVIKEEVRNLSINRLCHGYFPFSPPIVLMNYTEGRPLLLLYETRGKDKHGEPIYSKKNVFPPFLTLQCAYKLLSKLSALHQTQFLTQEHFSNNEELDGLLHRDLKPANILVDIKPNETLEVAIIDYADMIPNRKDGNNSTTCCGSNGYVPPEVIGDLSQRKPYVKQSDYFQMGVVIAEMMSSHMYQVGVQKAIREHGLNFNEFWSLKHMQKLMSDVFKKPYVLKSKSSLFHVEESTQDIIFKTLIFPALRDLVISMTQLEPTLRLKNSTLELEIARFKAIEKISLRLSNNLQNQVQNALEFWELEKELSKDLSPFMPLNSSNTNPTPQEQMRHMELDMKLLIKTLVDNMEGNHELNSASRPSF